MIKTKVSSPLGIGDLIRVLKLRASKAEQTRVFT